MWTSGFVWLPLLAMETRKHIIVTYYEDFWLSGGKMILPENQKCEVDSECCFNFKIPSDVLPQQTIAFPPSKHVMVGCVSILIQGAMGAMEAMR